MINRIDMVNEGVRLMLRHRDTASAVEAILDMAEPLIRADALSRFHVTEFPNGKVQTLIVDGTNWVSVSTANGMVDRARADERERYECPMPCCDEEE